MKSLRDPDPEVVELQKQFLEKHGKTYSLYTNLFTLAAMGIYGTSGYSYGADLDSSLPAYLEFSLMASPFAVSAFICRDAGHKISDFINERMPEKNLDRKKMGWTGMALSAVNIGYFSGVSWVSAYFAAKVFS